MLGVIKKILAPIPQNEVDELEKILLESKRKLLEMKGEQWTTPK